MLANLIRILHIIDSGPSTNLNPVRLPICQQIFFPDCDECVCNDKNVAFRYDGIPIEV